MPDVPSIEYKQKSNVTCMLGMSFDHSVLTPVLDGFIMNVELVAQKFSDFSPKMTWPRLCLDIKYTSKHTNMHEILSASTLTHLSLKVLSFSLVIKI